MYSYGPRYWPSADRFKVSSVRASEFARSRAIG